MTSNKSTQVDNNSQGDSNLDSSQESIILPEPDSENITVLTHSLPNKPILPWNRYDSPWDNTEEKLTDKEENPEPNSEVLEQQQEVETINEQD